jgi:hypothetical protein
MDRSDSSPAPTTDRLATTMRKWYWRVVVVALGLPWLQAVLLNYSPPTPQDWEHVKLVWTGALVLLVVGLLGECGRALWRVIR